MYMIYLLCVIQSAVNLTLNAPLSVYLTPVRYRYTRLTSDTSARIMRESTKIIATQINSHSSLISLATHFASL